MTILCVPTVWVVAIVLLAALLVVPPAIEALTARYERRKPRPVPVADLEKPPPWHAHKWKVPKASEGLSVGRCECGAQAAVLVG